MIIVMERNLRMECQLAETIQQPGELLPTMEKMWRDFQLGQLELQEAERLKAIKAKKARSATSTPEYVSHCLPASGRNDFFIWIMALVVRHICRGIIAVGEEFREDAPESGERCVNYLHRMIYIGRATDVEFAARFLASLIAVVVGEAGFKFGSVDCSRATNYTLSFAKGFYSQVANRQSFGAETFDPLRVELIEREIDARSRVAELVTSTGRLDLDCDSWNRRLVALASEEGFNRGFES